MKWMWHRFNAGVEDARPMTFPPPGPFWITGYDGDGHGIVVAYLPEGTSPTDPSLWPEAVDVESEEAPNGPEFSGRRPRPTWWEK